ncbi:MAG: metalloregulator ArsR/SmtB family transcription factor [Planctomycetes bacterium]|nr:metalloregulator ArsR/SmtB family transcription factor [Planctomycetota bacterium]
MGTDMNRKQLARYEARAKVIKALAHPARLQIVDELAERGERCVCELTELVGTDMSTVSRHLSQLKNAGLVADEKRGTMVYYRLRVKCLTNFFSCVEAVLEQNAREHRELVTLKTS